MKSFKFSPDPNQHPDEYDRDVKIRVFKGAFTKARFKALSRFVRSFTQDFGFCGHDYDCCGCLHRQHGSLEVVNHSEVIVRIVYSYNY